LIPTSEVVNLLKLSFHELEKLNPNGLTGQFFCPLELLRESHHVCLMWFRRSRTNALLCTKIDRATFDCPLGNPITKQR